MGTITQRVRKDGSIWHTAQIRLKQGGATMFTEAKTLDRKQAAKSWLKKRERKLAQLGQRRPHELRLYPRLQNA
ncbi:hypothetical protein Rmet_1990 [Cupriavidus metallidurans CH34]|uniref:Integrase n=1 Tax=Cupriavidus metallidurans (strain ATCC 43123 / DSM 2839 / NBRC 102507 / CH34) TaxID=266264 RepID=Q1LLV7_CUPMC|nr:hypothetical protein Rmet_1990 [Cupriavidus metallidurans CH34]